MVPLSGCLTLVLNHVLVPWLMGQKLGVLDIYSTLMMVGGVTMTTLAACHLDRDRPAEILLALIRHKEYMGAAASLAVTSAVCLGLLYRTPACLHKFRPALYAFLAGALGSHSTIFFKMLAELLKAMGRKHAAVFGFFVMYALLAIVFSGAQVYLINQAILQYDVTHFVPAYYFLLIGLGTLYGGIFYQEFEALVTPLQVIFYPLGLVITLLGVLLLSCRGGRGGGGGGGGRRAHRSPGQGDDGADMAGLEMRSGPWWSCGWGGAGGSSGDALGRYSKVPESPEIVATDPNMQDREELEFGLDNTHEEDDFRLGPGAASTSVNAVGGEGTTE